MKNRTKDSSVLMFRLGSAEANPQKVREEKRRMKGAKRRISTHQIRINKYRTIIRERAVKSVDKEKVEKILHLGEPEVEEYRMKLLKEKGLLMAAKRDEDVHRTMYEELVGENTADFRAILKDERDEAFARRFGRTNATKVMGMIKSSEATFSRFLNLAEPGSRPKFRSEIKLIVDEADAKLAELFDRKPKLFTRVIEVLVEELRNTESDGGAQ
jgi:hypothetical protein